MSGKSLRHFGFIQEVIPSHVSVKEAVIPSENFQGCDVVLGPEMRSTGEVMGIEFKFPMAFSKAQITENQKFPLVGTTFLSLSDFTKPRLPAIANRFIELGFTIVATTSTASLLKMEGIPVERVLKLHEEHPHVDGMIANGSIQLLVIANSGDALDQIDG